MFNSARRIVATTLICSASFWVAGCEAKVERPKTVPVSGVVNWNGKPLTEGSVYFAPDDKTKGHPAVGSIGPDGKYVLSTFEKGDGAVPGTYKIAVQVMQGADEVAKKIGKKVLPDKYYDASISGLTATIGPDDAKKEIPVEVIGLR